MHPIPTFSSCLSLIFLASRFRLFPSVCQFPSFSNRSCPIFALVLLDYDFTKLHGNCRQRASGLIGSQVSHTSGHTPHAAIGLGKKEMIDQIFCMLSVCDGKGTVAKLRWLGFLSLCSATVPAFRVGVGEFLVRVVFGFGSCWCATQ